MITLSLNFDGIAGPTERATHEKKVKEIIGTHFAFPGSDKLKMGVTIKDNGSSSVTFAGPQEVVSEAKRLWTENVQPEAKRIRSMAVNASATLKKKAASTLNKVSKATAPKKKKARVAVKASVSRRNSPKKKK